VYIALFALCIAVFIISNYDRKPCIYAKYTDLKKIKDIEKKLRSEENE